MNNSMLGYLTKKDNCSYFVSVVIETGYLPTGEKKSRKT